MRSIRAIEHSDICILLIDAERGFESQDQRIFHIADRNNKGIIILVNKWDLINKSTETAKEFEEKLNNKITPLNFAPVIFTSVLNKQRIHKVLESAINVYENRSQKITTSQLNNLEVKAVSSNSKGCKVTYSSNEKESRK